MMYDPVTDSFTQYESVKPNKVILPTMENIGYQPDITDIGIPTEDGNVIMKPARTQQQLISPEEIFTPQETNPIETQIESTEKPVDYENPTQTTYQNTQNIYQKTSSEYKGMKLLSNRLNNNQKSIATNLIQKLMTRGEFTDYQAAGILGNIAEESQFKTNAYNSNDVGKPGGGLAGFRGDELKALKTYANSKGKSWTDLDTQVDFIISRIKSNPKVYNAIMSSKNELEAAKAYMLYEKFAGYDGTLNSARSFQKQMKWSDEKTMDWINKNHLSRISYANEIYTTWKTQKKKTT